MRRADVARREREGKTAQAPASQVPSMDTDLRRLNTYALTVTDAAGLTAKASVDVFAFEGIVPGRLAFDRGGVRYRASSESSPLKPGDLFFLSVKGLELERGDRLAFSLNGHRIGDLTRQNGLTLDDRLRAEERLSGGVPDRFFQAKLRYHARKRRLRVAAKGVYDGGPVIQAQSGVSDERILAIYLDRVPADGVMDAAVFVPVRLRVRVRSSGNNVVRETGRQLYRR